MELFRNYFKLPFKLDDYGCDYVWDATGCQMVLQFDDDINQQIKNDVVNAINTGEVSDHLKRQNFAFKEEEIFCNGEFMMCLRGWGYLTGQGSLSLSDGSAIEIQNSLRDYIMQKIQP